MDVRPDRTTTRKPAHVPRSDRPPRPTRTDADVTPRRRRPRGGPAVTTRGLAALVALTALVSGAAGAGLLLATGAGDQHDQHHDHPGADAAGRRQRDHAAARASTPRALYASTGPRRRRHHLARGHDDLRRRLALRRAVAVAIDGDRHRLRRRRQGPHRHRRPRRRRRLLDHRQVPGRDDAHGQAAGQGQRHRRRRPLGRPLRADAAPARAGQLGRRWASATSWPRSAIRSPTSAA